MKFCRLFSLRRWHSTEFNQIFLQPLTAGMGETHFFPILFSLSPILFTEVLIPFRLNLVLVWQDFLCSGQK
jgi:hypothetical protein